MWYSTIKRLFLIPGQANLLIISLFFVACIFFSALIPPLQSPDEPAHIQRAYLLSQGTIILEHPQGHRSGGMVDSGLLAYMRASVSADTLKAARHIPWSGTQIYGEALGTGFYFPLIYFPQATGLVVGEKLGLTVDLSYRLARCFTLITIGIILLIAFSLYPVNPLTIALMAMPMSIFQFSSASLDGMATALSVFSIAAFLNFAKNKAKASKGLFYALAAAVMLLATSRVHALPLLALMFIPCIYFKKKKYYCVFVGALLAVLTWLMIAITTTVHNNPTPPANIALFYIQHPLAFAHVFWATVSSPAMLIFYCRSFFGILRQLNIFFNSEIYIGLLIACTFIGLLSISTRHLKTEWVPRLLLMILAASSILLIFFALLVDWTPHPASIIVGVQGRYFLIPILMLAYAIAGNRTLSEGICRKIALFFCAALFIFTISATTKLLLSWYYLALPHPS